MHAVRNQPQGIIEMPGEHHHFHSCAISDQDQTLAMTLQRLAEGTAELSSAESNQASIRLRDNEVPQQLCGLEIVFADSMRLELELATEMESLLEKLQKAKLKRDHRNG